MTAHWLISQVDSKYGIQLHNLPFEAGQRVEVIVLPEEYQSKTKSEKHGSSLSGTLLKYDLPFESATDPTEWEVLR